MEGLVIKGNAPGGANPHWATPTSAAGGMKPIQPSTNKASQVDQEEAVADSLREISLRNEESVKVLAERLQSFLDSTSYSLQFVPDNKNGRVIIKVLDHAGEVIRQIPPEHMARLADELQSFTGLLVDEKLE